MNAKLRTSDFKFGVIHGKIKPVNKDSEAAIQRNIFLSQRIEIVRSKKDRAFVRLFAYEMPLGYRKKRVDLLGYDQNHDLFIIELKDRKNRQELAEVEEQINDYQKLILKIKRNMEKEFQEIFHLAIRFKAIKKAILAPQEFFKGKKPQDKSIEYLFIKSGDAEKYRKKEIEAGAFSRSVKVHVNKFK
jgi:hypothetical protein